MISEVVIAVSSSRAIRLNKSAIPCSLFLEPVVIFIGLVMWSSFARQVLAFWLHTLVVYPGFRYHGCSGVGGSVGIGRRVSNVQRDADILNARQIVSGRIVH